MDENTLHIDPQESDLIRFISGECSEEESERIFALIDSNAAVREKYNALLESADEYDANYLDSHIDVSKAKHTFFEQIQEEEATDTKQVQLNKPRYPWLKIAAAILILLLPAGYYITHINSDKILTGSEKVSAYRLPDNSTVWINANSELRFSEGLSKRKRSAKLIGEAYFEIESNPEQPFFINTPGAIVKVVGTAFNIHDYKNDSIAIISVTEGIVEVYSTTEELLKVVQAGEQLQVNKNNESWVFSDIHNNNFQAWKTGVLKFRDTYLVDALSIISQHYTIPIELLDSSLDHSQINSTFSEDSIESVLEILSFMYNLSVDNQDSIIYISSIEQP